MKRAIVRRKYIALSVILKSPLSVLSGADIYTDMDVLRNGRGEVFIPGTSLAGAFRSYLRLKRQEPGIFGYSEEPEDVKESREIKSRMSQITISDLYFTGKTVVSVRDGVRLGEEKVAEDKGRFDQEIIETGAEGVMYLSCTIREQDDSDEFEQLMRKLVQAVQAGEIRFGARKNRGFGRLSVQKIYESEFDASTAEKWLEFEKDPKNLSSYERRTGVCEWLGDRRTFAADKYIFLSVPLCLTGGISIRRYSANPGQADYEQITCNGKPVVPGSSWNGMIRAEARDILRELGCCDEKRLLEQWFGYVGENRARQSMVLVGESILTGSKALPMTRNQVDRFSAAAKSGALYSEISYYGGKTVLSIGVEKNETENYQALLGLLLLIIEEIRAGEVAVGGQTAVGRGIFSGDGRVEFSEKIDEAGCKRALAKVVREEAAV